MKVLFEMNNTNSKSSFSKLKPLCISFLKDCSVENIEKFEKAVKELDSESIQPLLEYIVLPFRAQLSTKLQENIAIRCINFLTCVFKKSNVNTWVFFADIFNLMILKISDHQEINKLANVSEELKLSVCENIHHLIGSATEEVLNEMFSISFRPNLAHAFYLFNIMLVYEKSKMLQKAVLSTIGSLTYNEMFVGKKFQMTEEIASEALASCLPGLSIALQKVACGDIKQAHNILVIALNVLADLIVRVVGDASFERCIVKDTSSEVYCFAYKKGKLINSAESSARDDIPVVLKNESWYNTVSEKLEILISKLTLLAGHTHWKVRFEFLKFVSSLLLKCTVTLKNCVPILLPTVFGLSVDDNEEISSYCTDLLSSFSEKFQDTHSTPLNSLIEDNIDNLTSELIKCKISANDNKKLTVLKSLLGYIEILSSSISSMLFSMVHIEKILLMLITLLEFDTSDLSLVEEIPVTDTFDVSNLPWPKKLFKFFDNEEILNTVCKICCSLGRIQNSHLLIDFLIDKLSSHDLSTLQCIYLIGNVFNGFSVELDVAEKYSWLVNDVLETFLSNAMIDPPLTNPKSENTHLENHNAKTSSSLITSNAELKKNKLQICLILEAIAKCSQCLKNDFKAHLTYVLCPVMEKTGSSHFIISQCGRLCLYYISKSCGYSSINKLIKENADYITNILLINFHQYFYKPEIAVVLRIAMEQCDSEALVLFRDLISQILNTLDYNQDKAYFLMSVLFSVVLSIKQWFPSQQDIMKKTVVTCSSKKDLGLALADYIASKKSEYDCNYEDVETDKIESNGDTFEEDHIVEETKPETPLHVNITCEIFKRCIHLQSTENVYFRMLVLETVELCVLVLRDHENQLHPLVHEFWGPFLRRFLEETFISKAFNILLNIANECGDFVRQRTFKDIMPKLVNFLQTEYSRSHLKCNFRHYQWTNDHYLQILILSEIGYLCTRLDVDDKDICAVADVCLPYLEKHQPKVLQDAAVKSLKALVTLNSDAIWYYYNTLYSENKVIQPTHNSLKEIYFPVSNSSLTEIKIDVLLNV